MRARPLLSAAVLLCALVAAVPASAGTGMFVGAAEDAARSPDPERSATKMALAHEAGMDAVRVTSTWAPGLSAPTDHELQVLRNVVAAAEAHGVRVVLSVYHKDQRTTPRTAAARAQFASYVAAIAREIPAIRDFIIGNEPNLNLFWMPQFDKKGRSASPAAYMKLLARAYDALKAVSEDVNVIGGSVSPRGADRPKAKRQTHSPVRFITQLGAAYRASRRERPIMDAFAFHPYLIPSRLPPTFRNKHPRNTTIGLSDYEKLRTALATLDWNTQQGAHLPIVYDEFGYQSVIPPAKEEHYTNLDAPAARDAIAEATQAAYYRKALAIAQCQPNVAGILLFHVTDEKDARAWQSGLYYADDTPKTSLPAVRSAIESARAGSLARCRGQKWTDPVERVSFPEETAFPAANDLWRVRIDCERPCVYSVRLAAGTAAPFSALGALGAKTAQPLLSEGLAGLGPMQEAELPREQLAPGSYRFVVRAYEITRTGAASVRYSEPFAVGEELVPGPEPPVEPPVPSAP